MTEPEPPLVTIVDPNAPAGTPDLLDSGRDPWRPSRRQVGVGAVVLLLAALVAGVGAQVRHVRAQHAAVRHERALDRAALAAVSLTVGVAEPQYFYDGPDSPPLQLTLTNQGPDTIHLTALTLEGAHVPVEFGGDLPAGVANGFDMPARTSCGDRAGRVVSRTVTVSLTTDRGDPLTEELPLTSEGNDVLNGADRRRCRTLLPSEALTTSVGLARRSAGWVLADLTAANQSVLPLTLSGFVFPDGLEVRASGLPAALPPQLTVDHWPPERTVHLRVRVTSCSRWSRATDPVGIQAVLDGRFEHETANVQLSVDGEGPTAPGLFYLLSLRCPGTDLFRDAG